MDKDIESEIEEYRAANRDRINEWSRKRREKKTESEMSHDDQKTQTESLNQESGENSQKSTQKSSQKGIDGDILSKRNSEYAKRYREKHREQLKESRKRYREAHREELNARRRARYREKYVENLEHNRELARKSYQKNREQILERRKKKRMESTFKEGSESCPSKNIEFQPSQTIKSDSEPSNVSKLSQNKRKKYNLSNRESTTSKDFSSPISTGAISKRRLKILLRQPDDFLTDSVMSADSHISSYYQLANMFFEYKIDGDSVFAHVVLDFCDVDKKNRERNIVESIQNELELMFQNIQIARKLFIFSDYRLHCNFLFKNGGESTLLGVAISHIWREYTQSQLKAQKYNRPM